MNAPSPICIRTISLRGWILTTSLIACTLLLAAGCRPPDPTLLDFDQDGVVDTLDAFPTDPSETSDRDGDGVGDNADAFPDDDSRASAPSAPDQMPVDDDDEQVPQPPADEFAGEPGEPISGLSAAELTQFSLGSSLFAQTFTTDDGLAEDALGESCTSCHGFAPIGSAGGVHTIRVIEGDGERLVMRNASPLFGIGLFERVSDSEILLRQDVLDADGNGISGRANVDVDRVGRYGRKAQAATLDSIIRGMLLNQLGILAESAAEAQTFSRLEPGSKSTTQAQVRPPDPQPDDDEQDMIELDAASTEAIVAFQAGLGLPQRGEVDASVVSGEQIFSSIGCADCHLPELRTEDGEPLRAYTDLLLHDMGDDSADGITSGVALESEFRTQPLWGLADAAPYLHDGSAQTIREAIEAHGGEAADSAAAYSSLSDAEQTDLLNFLRSL